MSVNFDSFNLRRTVREGIDTDNMEFMPLKDYIGGEIVVDGYFFTQGKYGKQVVVVGNGAKINMPGYAVKNFERIDADEAAVAAVLDGKLKIVDIEELSTKNGITVAFRLTNA